MSDQQTFCLISLCLWTHFRSFDNSNTCSTFRSIIDIFNESPFKLYTEHHFSFTKRFCIKTIIFQICWNYLHLQKLSSWFDICSELIIKRYSFYHCTKCLCDIRFFLCQTDKGRIKGLDTRKFISRMLEKYRTIKNNG